MKIIPNKTRIQINIFFILIAFLQSCSLQLISKYDEISDNKITSLQEKVSTLFVKLENSIGTSEADYKEFKSLYEQIKVDISTLSIRADAIDKNEIVQQQIQLLAQNLDALEKLHAGKFNNRDQLKPLKNNFNTAFTAMVKLQLALKRGENQ